MSDPNAVSIGHYLAAQLQAEGFLPQQTTIFIDGPRPDQKVLAKASRGTQRTKTIKTIRLNIASITKKSREGKWSSGTVMKDTMLKVSSLFILDNQFKSDLKQGLQAVFASIVLCDGEADTAIAVAQRDHPTVTHDGEALKRVAVSIDSDFLIYQSIQSVLRKMPQKSEVRFRLYHKTEVMKALGFGTPLHLLLYGIINTNDYTRSIYTLGLVRNMNIVRSLQGSIESMLAAYIQTANALVDQAGRVALGHFDLSLTIFYLMRPTYDDVNSQLDDLMFLEMFVEFIEARDLRLENLPDRSTFTR